MFNVIFLLAMCDMISLLFHVHRDRMKLSGKSDARNSQSDCGFEHWSHNGYQISLTRQRYHTRALPWLVVTSMLQLIVVASLFTNVVSAHRSAVAPNFALSPPQMNRARILYKTTYACEHNQLHLNCEPNESIHLVRANYGRFSLSICNEGGRLDLSVMCMSYRSFLIMTDRCSNKSNCSVLVSSKLFGDPCPGTPKYLEVQYHCVRGGASLVPSSEVTSRPPTGLDIPLLGNSSASYPLGSSTIQQRTTNFSSNSGGVQNVEESGDSSVVINVELTTAQTHENNEPSAMVSSTTVPFPISSLDHNHPTHDESTSQLQLEEPKEPYTYSVEDYCPSLFFRSIYWSSIHKGEISFQKCPGGATGLVKWRCNYNSELEIAEWYPRRPDFSECRSLWLDNLEERLNNASEPVIRIASELALMSLTKPLYSDDLIRITRIIQEFLEHTLSGIQSLQTVEVWHRHQVLKELLMFVVEIISNLLGNGQDDAWLDLNIGNRKEVASALIKSLENSALLLAENTNHDGSSAIAKPNVLVSVHVLDTRIPISLQFPTYEDISGTNEWTRMEDSIFLPAQSLIDHSPGDLAKVSFFAYYRIEDLLKASPQTDIEEKYNSIFAVKWQNLSHNSLTINSRVIGAAISPNGELKRYRLSHPVTIVLRHIQEENISSPQCVYWNMELQNWLTDGCWVEATNSTHTVCMCNHLSHYALLSEIKTDSEALEPLPKIERTLLLTSSLLTLLVLAFVTILICSTPSGNIVSTSIHRNLCLSLLLLQFFYLTVLYCSDNVVLMPVSLAFLHYFLLTSLFWTFFEAFDIYKNINSIYEHFKSSRRLLFYYIFAYITPLGIVFICFSMISNYYQEFVNFWIGFDNYVYLTFVVPIIGLVLGSYILILLAYIANRSHAISATTIKCFEDIRLGGSKDLIRWILLLTFFESINCPLAFFYLSRQDSIYFSVAFIISNLCLSLCICLFCLLKVENIQHSRLFRCLPFPLCADESQVSNTKNSTCSDVYSTRPVVTQVTSTQVNGISVHTPMGGHSPSTPTASSAISMSSCLPQSHQLPISAHWTSQLETLKKSTKHDHQFTLARQDLNHLSSYNYNEDKTLPRDFESVMTKKRGKASINANRSSHVQRCSIQHSGENKYIIHSPTNCTPNMDHIYESIDSDSMTSTLYGQGRRVHLNTLYGINYRSKSTVNEDDLSTSSIYEDKPLLFSNTSTTLHHHNLKSRRNFMPQYYHSNASIYDKTPKEKLSNENNLVQAHPNPSWQLAKEDGLPDLLQKPFGANNLLVSYLDENKLSNRMTNSGH